MHCTVRSNASFRPQIASKVIRGSVEITNADMTFTTPPKVTGNSIISSNDNITSR